MGEQWWGGYGARAQARSHPATAAWSQHDEAPGCSHTSTLHFLWAIVMDPKSVLKDLTLDGQRRRVGFRVRLAPGRIRPSDHPREHPR